MMLVLSHIFGRKFCRETDDKEMKEKIRRSQSVVYLPPLPTKAAKVLRKHNADTLAIFTTYVKTFAAQHLSGEERKLPLTGVPVGIAAATFPTAVTNRSEVATGHSDIIFLPTLPIPHARSPFVALSGHNDTFTTIGDLCTSTRAGIFLESAVIPHIELHPDESRTPLNAYLLDFFSHGAIQPLEEANGIRKSDVWFALNDFSLVLATIVASLANYLDLLGGKRTGAGGAGEMVVDTGDDGLLMLDVMGSGDSAENEGDEQMAAEIIPSAPTDSGYASSNASASKAARKGHAAKSKKIVDEWDQGDDDHNDGHTTVGWVNGDSEEFEDGNAGAASDDSEYQQLLMVFIAFRRLKTEFDGKFREIFA
jgi:hypothetical protein